MIDDNAAARRMLIELHKSYLKNNKYDEGNLIYYRINYKLVDILEITKEEAEKYHADYHKENTPRRISEGYCHNCNAVVTIVPIIYGITENDKVTLKAAEKEGRLIIGSLDQVKEGNHVSMFGCKICKSALPRYGTIL